MASDNRLRSSDFRFKQFAVSCARSPMKVGTDGVLLGAWAGVEPGVSVLDVGAGCGVIGLMAAQRGASRVVGLEIDADAAEEAAANAAASPWAGICTMLCCDFADFLADDRNAGRFDLVVSNPPFFNEALRAPDDRRAMARHGRSLTVESLVAAARRLLTPSGRLALIAPVNRTSDIEMAASLARIDVVRRCAVSSRRGQAPIRILWELSPAGGPLQREAMTVGDEYYKKLVSPFYLKL